MAGRALRPLRLPDGFWSRADVREALGRRDVGALFRLVAKYAGASQTQIAIAVGMTQSQVSNFMRRTREVTAIDVAERTLDGLAATDDARMAFGLAPRIAPTSVVAADGGKAAVGAGGTATVELVSTATPEAAESSGLSSPGIAPAGGLGGVGTEAAHPSEVSDAELRLASDQAVSSALSWLDESAGWSAGTARRWVAELTNRIDLPGVRDLAQRRGRVTRGAIADFLRRFYGLPACGYDTYSARIGGAVATTSVLTRPEWTDVSIPLAGDRERFTLDGGQDLGRQPIDQRGAEAAVARLAIGFAAGGQLVNSTLYRLADLAVVDGQLRASVALTEFVAYALTMDLLEGETIDAIAAGVSPTPESLPLRSRYLPAVDAVTRFGERLCAGGPLALFAAARPAGRGRPRPDFVLLVQERSGRVLNAAHRLAVIPKAFHQPLVDVRAEAAISVTLEREMEEELFGRPELDSTAEAIRHADPLHASLLSAPFRWLLHHPDAWRLECTGFGLNLVSGNFEFPSLIVIEREEWWEEHGGSVQANWESDGLRQYSSLDRDLVQRLAHDVSWSNEGLFAFLLGIRRLAEVGGDRVDLPAIEREW